MKSFTDSLSGNDVSFGTEINYPNDFFNFRIGYLQIGENYTPGLGFVPRKNIRDFYGGIGFGPRPKNSPVMQVKSGMKYIFITDLKMAVCKLPRLILILSEIIFLSGDKISLASQYQYEALEKDFKIFGRLCDSCR